MKPLDERTVLCIASLFKTGNIKFSTCLKSSFLRNLLAVGSWYTALGQEFILSNSSFSLSSETKVKLIKQKIGKNLNINIMHHQ